MTNRGALVSSHHNEVNFDFRYRTDDFGDGHTAARNCLATDSARDSLAGDLFELKPGCTFPDGVWRQRLER